MKTKHETGEFISHDGIRIHHQGWTPQKDDDIRAVLAIVHGYAEHGGRYAHVGEYFAQRGFHVEALDHRGHGLSDGSDTFFRSIDDCVGDVDLFVTRLRERRPGRPLFVLAHSMGGLITARWVQDRQPELNGVLLSGPAVMIDESISPFLLKISGFLAAIAPKMKTVKLDGDAVSRDPDVVAKYNSDPLNYRKGVPAATGAAINSAIEAVHRNAGKFSLPVRIMYGTDDRLADPRGSIRLHAGFSSEDKSLIPYEGLYHEILNEPEQEKVMSDCLEWITARM